MSTRTATGIDFSRAFGGAQPAATAPAQERVPANHWLNIGFEVDLNYSDGSTETKFVSLPLGVPLDNMNPVRIRGNDPDFVQLQQAQNRLLEMVKQVGDSLKPGEATILQLAVQLRRVSDPKPETTGSDEENVFVASMPSLIRPAQPTAE